MLESGFTDMLRQLEATAERLRPRLTVREVGRILEVGQGIARVSGLDSVTSESLVRLPDNVLGMAVNLDADDVGLILLGDSERLVAGAEVTATGRTADTPVGDGLLGRVIDATGRVLDDGKPLVFSERRPIERPAPAIIKRAPVTRPLETGIKAIDALIPIGRGQRELIIGDRQTGKTSVALDTLINQRDKGVVCVYCAIGQRGTAVARVIDTLRDTGALEHTIVVVASDEDPPGLRYITPYAATTMAEHFLETGQDVLIVYDDLTRHARAYRELSLLLRRPPGREAYPGDIFYIHSRLLERATHLKPEHGGGSLTALPVIETQAQDISAYIPTNLISITDGQIYLSPTLFHRGQLPAIDIGKSVSRVGGKTQYPAFRALSGPLRLAYSQFEELESFARFSTRLDDTTRRTIKHGRRIRALLNQPEHHPLSAGHQLVVLKAVAEGLFDELPMDEIARGEHLLLDDIRDWENDCWYRLTRGEALNDTDWKRLMDKARTILAPLMSWHREV